MMYRAILITLALMLSPSLLSAKELVLVVRADSELDTIKKGELKRLYLGKSNIVQRSEFTAINLSQQSELSKTFLLDYLNMTEQKYIKWWVKQQIIGRARPPVVLSTDAEVINLVLLDKNYMGYIDKENLTSELKVVKLVD